MALSFLRHCVHKDWIYIVEMSDTLEGCLSALAVYSSSEELYLRRMLEEMRAHEIAQSFKEDKAMLVFFEKSIMKKAKQCIMA